MRNQQQQQQTLQRKAKATAVREGPVRARATVLSAAVQYNERQ